MLRFEHFDVGRYLDEYYGLPTPGAPLSADNQVLLEFFDTAYTRVQEAQHGKKLKILEVGGGPTLYQLLSAGRVASEICFTDLLAANVSAVRQAADPATTLAGFDWTPYSSFVQQLEAGTTVESPLARLQQVMRRFSVLDVGDTSSAGKAFPGEMFDVVSACFVFEASCPVVAPHFWSEHLRNTATRLAPGGHLVMTALLGTGAVVEGGRLLPTPELNEDIIRTGLADVGFTDVSLELIESQDDNDQNSTMTIAALTARYAPQQDEEVSKEDCAAVARFVRKHFRHFNAAAIIDAADGYRAHLEKGGRMFVTLAGAMSTAEIGVSLAEMIRAGKVHGLSVTGANLEEDFFNLIAHNSYKRVPDYRSLSKADEQALYDSGMNRVTDTCIPEEEAFRRCETALTDLYQEAAANGELLHPHELFYRLIRRGTLEHYYEIDPKDSWLVAAAEADLPIVVPGWEDSTCGNIIVANKIAGNIDMYPIKSGLEQMETLVDWYTDTSATADIGFFQVGGGIAGDFPVCVVPLLRQDLQRDVKLWSYFGQISDGTTSYGGYSAAPPNEKITWGKLSPDTPSHIIESDATIVWPLLSALVLSD